MKRLRPVSNLFGALALPIGIALVVQGSVPATPPVTPVAPPVTPVAQVDGVRFSTDVLPILEKSCVSCHGGTYEGEPRTELSLNLSTYEGVMAGSEYGTILEAGNPDESLLVEMIENGDMPEEGDPLSADEIATIRSWIAEGATKD